MADLTFYLPDDCVRGTPVVIGLPGFLHSAEEGRCDKILDDLANRHNIAGVRLSYSGISSLKEGKEIVCSFNLDRYLRDLAETFDEVKTDGRFDFNRVGIFASSMSGAIFGHYLASHMKNHQKLFFLSLSPLPGWSQFATPDIRENIIRNNRDIPLTSTYDRGKGIRRYIPKENLDEVQKVDSLKALELFSPPIGLKVMTLAGEKDEVANPESIRRYHELLGGRQEDFFVFDSGHDIGLSLCKGLIMEFFRSSLQLRDVREF